VLLPCLLAESHFGFVLKPWTRHLLMYAESTQHTRLEDETRLAMFYCRDTRQGTEYRQGRSLLF
jgi:hypothetical protein